MDTEVKVYRDTLKKDILFWKYAKIRYENFSFLILSVKEDCASLEKLRKLQRVVLIHVLCALCALGFKKYGKVRKLERFITQRSIPVWVLTSRHIEYE